VRSARTAERPYDLCLRNCPLVAHWTRKVAQVCDKSLDHRIELSILERHDDGGARPIRQIDAVARPPAR
jgi:hypothetical protein